MARHKMSGTVAETILRRLAMGEWLPPQRFPSVRELAETCGISAKTMMVALRQLADDGLLQMEQRKRIQVAPGAAERARELLANQEKPQSQRNLAILFPEGHMPYTRNAFYAALIQAIMNEAAKIGVKASVVPWSVQNQMSVAESLVHCGFDRAVIVNFNPMYSAAVFGMHERGYAFMIFNHRLIGLDRPSVVMYLHSAAYSIAERLAAFGHRNMCLIAHPPEYQLEVESDLPQNRGRVSGWLEYLKEHELIDCCTLPLYMPWEPVLGLFNRTFRDIMSRPDRPTAIVFSHSPWARKFVSDSEFAALRVPLDLSLVTFETAASVPTNSFHPLLTSISIDHERTAQCIMEIMDKMVQGKTDIPTIRVPLDTNLTDSIGPAPKA